LKFDFSTPVLDAFNRPVIDGITYKRHDNGDICVDEQGDAVVLKAGKPLTMGAALFATVSRDFPGDDKLTGPQKIELFLLQQKMANSTLDGHAVQDLKAEEVTTLRDRALKVFGHMVYARVSGFLDKPLPEPPAVERPAEAGPTPA
jgi:hypothetical protein